MGGSPENTAPRLIEKSQLTAGPRPGRRGLIDEGVPIVLTCWVLRFAHQFHYDWLADPVTY